MSGEKSEAASDLPWMALTAGAFVLGLIMGTGASCGMIDDAQNRSLARVRACASSCETGGRRVQLVTMAECVCTELASKAESGKAGGEAVNK